MSNTENHTEGRQPITRKRFLSAAFALTLGLGSLSGLAACGQTQQATTDQSSSTTSTTQASTRTFTDSAGRTVELPAEVTKVAVSGPMAQQVLLTFDSSKLCGLASKIGDDQKAYLGDSLADLPIFGQIYGGKGDFNKEEVAAAGPDVVIDIGDAKKTIVEDMDNLQETLGVPCIHLEASLDTWDQVYTQLGEILGETDRAKELADYARTSYDEVKSVCDQIPEDERPTVAYLVGDEGLGSMAGGTQGAVVDLVAKNALTFEKGTYSGKGQEVNLEQIAAADPQMIIFGPNSIYDTVASDSSWSSLTAIANGNYYQVPDGPYNWMSSPACCNQLLGLQWFARLCYPTKFSDSTADAAKKYFKLFYNHDLTDDELNTLLEGAVAKS